MLVLWESKTKRVKLLFNPTRREFEIWFWKYKTNTELTTNKSEEFPGKISSVIAKEITQAKKQLQYYNNLGNNYPINYFENYYIEQW